MTGTSVASVALIDGIDVDAVAAAVTACPGVSALFGGRGDAIASYLPGRRVPGVEVTPKMVTIHVRSRWDVSAPALLTEISAAVAPLLHHRRLAVVVADIDDPEPPAPPVSLTIPAASASGAPELVAPRPPGSSPAPTALAPTPAPPAFPTV